MTDKFKAGDLVIAIDTHQARSGPSHFIKGRVYEVSGGDETESEYLRVTADELGESNGWHRDRFILACSLARVLYGEA